MLGGPLHFDLIAEALSVVVHKDSSGVDEVEEDTRRCFRAMSGFDAKMVNICVVNVQCWKAKMSSLGGLLIMIKSGLVSLSLFYMLFKMSKRVETHLGKLMRDFLREDV